MTKLTLIFLGGGIGSVARYLVAGCAQRLAGGVFPFGTLTVNLLGCLLIGVLGAVFAGPVLVREEYRFALMVGFLGGFTTFSTFGYETFQLANDRQLSAVLLNIAASNLFGLAAVWLGYRLTERWIGV